MTRKMASIRMARLGPIDDTTPFYTDNIVFMTDALFEECERGGAIDTSIYGWGHAGPVYYAGRIVIRAITLGG